MKKRALAVVLLLCMCLCLSACGGRRASEPVVTEPPAAEPVVETPAPTPVVVTPVIPAATSDSAKLYAFAMANGHRYVVDEFGRYTNQYAFDEIDNLVDLEGEIVVLASNVKTYKPIRTMYFSQEVYALTAEGSATTTNEGENALSSTQIYSNCVVELYCAPASATNGIICVRSDSDAVVEIRPNSNAKFVTLEAGMVSDGEVAIKADDLALPVKVYVRVLTNTVGSANIYARSIDNTSEAECVVTVELTEARQRQVAATTTTGGTAGRAGAVVPSPSPSPLVAPVDGANEFVNASGNPTNHVHTYQKSVVAPTTSSMGYTEYTCSSCGYSYLDDFTPKLAPTASTSTSSTSSDHVHNYVGKVVPATETAQGYTLYTCSECGNSYKANYTPATGK